MFVNINLPTTLFLLIVSLTQTTYAGIQQSDFTGKGHISVLASSDSATASPSATVGCLDAYGKFIANDGSKECGVFSRRNNYPYTLSTAMGNCTFQDTSQERNTDSAYGKGDYAWSCTNHQSDIYDELYTVTGLPVVLLCFGDLACFFDAKHVPTETEALPLWQYRWGSQQLGITPGHVQLQLMWEKIDDLSKRGRRAARSQSRDRK